MTTHVGLYDAHDGKGPQELQIEVPGYSDPRALIRDLRNSSSNCGICPLGIELAAAEWLERLLDDADMR